MINLPGSGNSMVDGSTPFDGDYGEGLVDRCGVSLSVGDTVRIYSQEVMDMFNSEKANVRGYNYPDDTVTIGVYDMDLEDWCEVDVCQSDIEKEGI